MDARLQFIPIMIVGFGAALCLTPLTRQIAMRLGVTAAPNTRNIHQRHVPLMGGAAIYVAFVLSVLLFSPPDHLRELGAIVAGASLLAIVGYLDDRRHLSPRVRLSAMTLAAALAALAGIQIRLFNNDFIDIPLTLFWIVALINAVNWIDNMDGLAAGTAAIASGFFLLLALTQGQILVSMLAASIFGSALGFLIYNFNPSSTFMGDMGAYTLGFVLAILAIKLKFAAQPLNVTWMVPVFVLALPVLDINLAIATRLLERRPLMLAAKDHVSHRILDLGATQRQTLALLYLFSLVFGLVALAVSQADVPDALALGGASLLVLAAVFCLLIVIRWRGQAR
ncbi:MAG: undecaprenyl/decaprenyl-phosphate alpha-N-acetylglucosaminyl 1-phosphate transferase [Chloroflexi bacterium]|nr:undecaprenyl/decaprenyl-phosphate alpha-N-acetylglucosaminyl 1-phosphate transferase [Chloroflexota bacterium]